MDGKKVLDAAEGRRRRDDAIARVGANADPEFNRAALDALYDLAARSRRVTSDGVWFLLDRRRVPAPDEPRAMGPVFRRAKAAKLIIEEEGADAWTLTSRPQAHRGPMRVWKSLVYLP